MQKLICLQLEVKNQQWRQSKLAKQPRLNLQIPHGLNLGFELNSEATLSLLLLTWRR